MKEAIFSIELNPEREDKNIALNGWGCIELCVNTLDDIYPKLSDRMIKVIKKQYDLDKKCGIDNFTAAYISSDALIKAIQKDLDKSVDIEIKKCGIDEIESINKLLPKGSHIIIENAMKEEKFINNNKFRNDFSFSDKYNMYSDITLDELKNYVKSIHDIAKEVSKYNFSNLEKIIYISDKIRKRVYKDNDHDESITRDISKLLNDDYIVCEGYANLFEAICNDLNIGCEKLIWNPVEGIYGHASNVVYINDDKYNIHNFYEIDLTAHSKNNEEDKEYLVDYDFIKPMEVTNRLRQRQGYKSIKEGHETYINRLEVKIERYTRMIELGAPDVILTNEKNLMNKEIVKISELIGRPSLIENMDNTEQNIFDYKDLWCNYIPEEILISAIYNVRRVEYIEDHETYQLDEEIIMQIVRKINSFIKKNENILLLQILFGLDSLDSIVAYNDYFDSIQCDKTEDKILADMNRIKMLSYMKNELQNKRNAK